jgi:L-threonylcarbamoyladenylate synthase
MRPGSIRREQLQGVLGRQVQDAGPSAPRASGRLEKHYSPDTPLSVVSAGELAAKLAQPGSERIAVLAPLGLLERCRADVALAIAAPDRADDYARLLYASLHRLDTSGAARLIVAAPPAGPQWEAVNDRLRRAQSGAAYGRSATLPSDYDSPAPAESGSEPHHP